MLKVADQFLIAGNGLLKLTQRFRREDVGKVDSEQTPRDLQLRLKEFPKQTYWRELPDTWTFC